MERRKFLIGAGSAAVGSSALIGSGAFSSVQAERDIELSIQPDDENPYLGLDPGDSKYASLEDGGLVLSFENNDHGGDGLTSRANTLIENVFTIENNGTKGVNVWMPAPPEDTTSDSTEFLVGDTDISYPDDDTESKAGNPIHGEQHEGGSAWIDAGDSVEVDVRFMISNLRDETDDRGKAAFLIRADTEEPDSSDWPDKVE